MNIEEAKQVLDKIQICSNEVGSVPLVETHKVKALLDQIDQPKVVTPKSVFEMIKFRKEHDHDLTTTFVNIHAYPDNVFHWVANNSDLFAQAWLAYPNITIEKEKLYTVEIPNPNDKQIALRLEKWVEGKVRIVTTHSSNNFTDDMRLTEREIRKDFEWAWREGFSEEVTDL